MEIKIIINAAGTGRGKRHFMDEGRRAGRGEGMGHGPRVRYESHRHGCRHERGEGSAERGRVIGKLVELPDGRVKVVRREGMETGGPRRHWEYEQREGRPHRHHEGPGHRVRRHGRDESDETRETRRERRRLAREIVRALEAGGYNKA